MPEDEVVLRKYKGQAVLMISIMLDFDDPIEAEDEDVAQEMMKAAAIDYLKSGEAIRHKNYSIDDFDINGFTEIESDNKVVDDDEPIPEG